MTHLSIFIDYFLYVVAAATPALIAFKAMELYPWRGRIAPRAWLGATENELQEKLERLEAGLVALAAIAAASPFVGLMGTVMHIVEALRNMGAGAPDMGLIGGPIATALHTTLVGLISAVPAVVAHGVFQRRIELLESRHRRLLAGDAK